MLDTARNLCAPCFHLNELYLMCFSFPVPDIKRTLDAMSWVKVNISPTLGA